MAAPYKLPANQTDITSMFQYANEVSGNIFGVGILITFYLIVVSYLILKGNRAEDSITVAGFSSTIMAVLIFFMGLISEAQMAVAIILSIISVIWSLWNKD